MSGHVISVAVALTLLAAGCGGDDDAPAGRGTAGGLTGEIAADGSRSVYPFIQAAAEQFQTDNPDVTIVVRRSRTRPALRGLCDGAIDIAGVPRSTARGACARPYEITAEALPRPLSTYVSEDAASRPEVRAFADFMREHAEAIAEAARLALNR
jgi:ABC-type phosphate transport system substrate-binding protein